MSTSATLSVPDFPNKGISNNELLQRGTGYVIPSSSSSSSSLPTTIPTVVHGGSGSGTGLVTIPSSSFSSSSPDSSSVSSVVSSDTSSSSSSSTTNCFCLSRSGFLSLCVSLFYGISSLLLGLLNKVILSQYNFNGYFLLLSAQLFVSLLICITTRDFFNNPLGIPTYDRTIHQSGALMGMMYVINVGAGLVGLQLVNVPMFSCIRRLVAPVILIYEYVILNKLQPRNVQVAVSLVLTGTVIAGWDTLSAELLGYIITMGNNVATAASTVMQKQFSETTKLSAFGVLYYNSWTALPLALTLSVFTGEIHELVYSFPYRYSPSFWFGFIGSCALGPLLTYSSMLSTTYNSPLATSITGNIKDIATTIIGAIFFTGFIATAKSVGGLLISFFGAGMYSYISLQRLRATKTATHSGNSSESLPSKIIDATKSNETVIGTTYSPTNIVAMNDSSSSSSSSSLTDPSSPSGSTTAAHIHVPLRSSSLSVLPSLTSPFVPLVAGTRKSDDEKESKKKNTVDEEENDSLTDQDAELAPLKGKPNRSKGSNNGKQRNN